MSMGRGLVCCQFRRATNVDQYGRLRWWHPLVWTLARQALVEWSRIKLALGTVTKYAHISINLTSLLNFLKATLEQNWQANKKYWWAKQRKKKVGRSETFFVEISAKSLLTSSGTMSRNLTSCERETDAVRWYSTNSLRLLNFTTHKKNFPCASLKTLKCCTPSEHLRINKDLL